MSSSEEQPLVKPSKKRRLQNACDICRKKKIKCDSATMPNNRCSNCIAFNSDCTHTEPVKKRGPKNGYVEQLEQRVAKMEAMLRKFQPDIQLNEPYFEDASQHSSPRQPSSSAGQPSSLSQTISSVSNPAQADSLSQAEVDDEDDLPHIGLMEQFSKMEIGMMKERFFGPSSGFMLVSDALKARHTFSGGENVSRLQGKHRPKFWGMQPWEAVSAEREIPSYRFPPPDLMWELIGHYFEKYNFLIPVLHEPSFRRLVTQGKYIHDPYFGAVLLTVCALGSRYSNDPRVLSEDHGPLSSGWKFFEQVQFIRKSMFDAPYLPELQFYCLSVLYVVGTSMPQASWSIVSIGMRYCQELGLHRRKPERYKKTAEDEMKLRCFWILFVLDRLVSSFVGRPTAIRDEDYDTEPPAECDDEFWISEVADPESAWIQSSERPSFMTFLIQYMRLSELLGFALRTLYTTKKSKLILGLVGEEKEQKTVAELDSALNRWLDLIPDHLRWDPNREDPVFFHQSAILHLGYYMLQIQIHRPFLQRGSSSFPHHTICVNAARASAHMLEEQIKRKCPVFPFLMMGSFTCGVVIIINLFAGRSIGVNSLYQRDMADLQTCIKYLRYCEERWHVAGRLIDLLGLLSSTHQVPVDAPPQRKRTWDETSTPDLSASPFPQQTDSTQSSSNFDWRSYASTDSSRDHPSSSSSNVDVANLYQGHYNLDPILTMPAAQAGASTDFDLMALGAGNMPVDFGVTDANTMSMINDMWSNVPLGFDVGMWGSDHRNVGPTEAAASASRMPVHPQQHQQHPQQHQYIPYDYIPQGRGFQLSSGSGDTTD